MNYLRGNVLFIFVLFFCQSNFCFSQNHPDSIGYFKSYLTNTRDVVVEPLHWNKQDIANFTMVAGATAFLMIYDEKIDHFVCRNQNVSLSDFSQNVIEPFGNGLYSLPFLGAFYLCGIASKNNYDKEIALLGIKAFVISAGEATLIKVAFQRHRPIDDVPPDAFKYDGPFHGLKNDGSLVSRHATTAFAIATVFAEGYKKEKRWVPFVAYSLASLVSISRTYNREHWASDAFAGACLGYFTGKFLFEINSGNLKKKIHFNK